MALGWKKDYLRYRELFLKLLVQYRKREDLKMFLEVLLSLVTISFFSIFALKPTVLTISQLIKDNKEKEQAISQMDKKIRNIAIAQNLFEQNSAKISLIHSAIPNSPSPEDMVRQIEGVSNINSAQILGTSVNEVTLVGEDKKKQKKQKIQGLSKDVKTISFSVSTTGSYSSLYNFLSNLENLRRPVLIDTINITSSETDVGKIIIMLISGQTPYIKSIE